MKWKEKAITEYNVKDRLNTYIMDLPDILPPGYPVEKYSAYFETKDERITVVARYFINDDKANKNELHISIWKDNVLKEKKYKIKIDSKKEFEKEVLKRAKISECAPLSIESIIDIIKGMLKNKGK